MHGQRKLQEHNCNSSNAGSFFFIPVPRRSSLSFTSAHSQLAFLNPVTFLPSISSKQDGVFVGLASVLSIGASSSRLSPETSAFALNLTLQWVFSLPGSAVLHQIHSWDLFSRPFFVLWHQLQIDRSRHSVMKQMWVWIGSRDFLNSYKPNK